jgi:hypothetical protein
VQVYPLLSVINYRRAYKTRQQFWIILIIYIISTAHVENDYGGVAESPLLMAMSTTTMEHFNYPNIYKISMKKY